MPKNYVFQGRILATGASLGPSITALPVDCLQSVNPQLAQTVGSRFTFLVTVVSVTIMCS
jgi:hypothetical protein